MVLTIRRLTRPVGEKYIKNCYVNPMREMLQLIINKKFTKNSEKQALFIVDKRTVGC